MIDRYAARLVAAGIPRNKLWNAHRNAVCLVYYRREFDAARKLLWDYWKEHPLDVRMLAYACITLLPSGMVASLRGRLGRPASELPPSGTVEDCAGWLRALAQISNDLAT